MKAFTKSASLPILALVVFSANVALAKPYYWSEQLQAEQPQQLTNVGNNVNSALLKGQDQIQKATQPAGQEGIGSHVNQLLSHGGSAVMGAVEKVQPDIKVLGKDLGNVLQNARDNVSRRIEPLTQTAKPYLDQAQKAVAPLVSQAREEVPKLINQAGPTISNLGEQVRSGLTGVWNKITSSTSQPSTGTGAVSDAQNVMKEGVNQLQQAGESVQKSASNLANQVTSSARSLFSI